MRRDLWSLILACGFGSFVGGLVALEIAERFEYGRYFWGFGAIMGGFAAYFAVDFRELCTGVARAYRATIAWQPDREYWKMFFLTYAAFSIMFFNAVLFFSLLAGLKSGLVVLAFIQVYCLLPAFLIPDASVAINDPDKIKADNMKQIIRKTNTITVLYWTIWSAVWLIRRVPHAVVVVVSTSARAARALGRFAATAFRYVHSRRRTISFGCAAIGAAVGYHAGSATIGAVAGMILGAAEHELVAIRWLKVVPNGGRA